MESNADPAAVPTRAAPSARRRAIGFVVAVGIGSLLADVVYEGARSIVGPFLATLGASAAFVGFISGIGEFVGYGLRIVAGWISDRTRSYWLLTIGGYALNVAVVPLLGLVGNIELATALLLAERLGKAIRVPARDTLISYASRPIGSGFAFGLHEALDQVGAVVGPLLLAATLALRPGDYRTAFLLLAVPAVLTVVALVSARARFPDAALPDAGLPARGHDAASELMGGAPPKPFGRAAFARYAVFTLLALVGFAPYPLIAFHLTANGVVSSGQVPLLFAFAMAVDAGVALIAGRAYDRRGFAVLVAVPLGTAATLSLFTTSVPLVWLGAAVWGAVLGIHESTLRAAVADLVPPERRGIGYGVFNSLYGIALLISGGVLGLLYERSIGLVIAFVVVAEVLALAAFVVMLRRDVRTARR